MVMIKKVREMDSSLESVREQQNLRGELLILSDKGRDREDVYVCVTIGALAIKLGMGQEARLVYLTMLKIGQELHLSPDRLAQFNLDLGARG